MTTTPNGDGIPDREQLPVGPDGLTDDQRMALQPRPVGGKWDVDVARPPAGVPEPAQVMVTVTDLTGIRVLFLDPDTADVVSGLLHRKAVEARAGSSLLLPPGGITGLFGGGL